MNCFYYPFHLYFTINYGFSDYIDTILLNFCLKNHSQTCSHLPWWLPSYHWEGERTKTSWLELAKGIFPAICQPVKKKQTNNNNNNNKNWKTVKSWLEGQPLLGDSMGIGHWVVRNCVVRHLLCKYILYYHHYYYYFPFLFLFCLSRQFFSQSKGYTSLLFCFVLFCFF